MSDIAAGSALLPLASLTAGPTPEYAGSAWPDSPPCSPWAGAARADADPPPGDWAPSERGTTAAAAAT
eukprot:11271477-Alexandrium_andersonii.AAC.1